ncbi:MAG TPA: IS5 family transposase [Terriglobales bacterium]|nr:IS5 family transposase [Terriglobales bacterium]
MASRSGLTEDQWARIEPLLPTLPRRRDGRGRPWRNNRGCFEGILWVLRTGARWRDMPSEYPSGVTCWRRLKEWEEAGVWEAAWRQLLSDLDRKGLLKWDEAFADGSFAPAKKGARKFGKTKRGKGTKWMLLVDGEGVPLGALLASASPAEVTLLEPTLEKVLLPCADGRLRAPQLPRIIADKAYDSDDLRRRLLARGTELIAPNRSHRKRKTADGRTLRRYRRRWKVERTFAWLSNFRRLAIRWDRLFVIYRGLFHVACLLIAARHL